MSSTNFVNGTVVQPAWLNDVNAVVYQGKNISGINVINVMDPIYGATGNGTTDDSAALIAALATGNSVYLPGGRTYKISSPISVNLAKQSLFSNSCFIDQSALTGTQVGVTLSNSTVLAPSDLYVPAAGTNGISGITFMGPGKAGSGAAFTSTVTGIQAYCPYVSMFNVLIYGYGYGLDLFSSSYVHSYVNVQIGECAQGIRSRAGGTNYGERIAFTNSVIYNNSIGVVNAMATGSIQFVNCSIDYNLQQFLCSNSSVTELHSCHWECADPGAGKVMASITGSSTMTIIGGHMQGNGTQGAFTQSGVFTTDSTSEIIIENTFLFNLQNVANCWDSAGSSGGRIKITTPTSYPVSYLPLNTSPLNNFLVDPTLEGSTFSDWWTITVDGGTLTNRLTGTSSNITSSTVTPHAGTRCLLWTKASAGNGDMALFIPVAGMVGRRFAVSAWLKSTSSTGTVFVSTVGYNVQGYNANGTPNIFNPSATASDTIGVSGTTAWTKWSTGFDRFIAPGTNVLAIYFGGNSFAGTLQVDDVTVNFY